MEDSGLVRQIREVENSIDDLELQLKIQRQVLKRLKAAIETVVNRAQDANIGIESPHIQPIPSRDDSQGSLVDKIARVLKEEGGPLRACEITRKLEEQGETSKTDTPLLMKVCATLYRCKNRFSRVKDRRGVYSLIEGGDI